MTAPMHFEHDITRESYCHTCGWWEPRWSNCIVCTECGHVFVTAVNVKTWGDYMERAGYDPLPPTLCPFCAGELQ